jgi:hypothetical protein
VIVRISSQDQYELKDEAQHHLEALDKDLSEALHNRDEHAFHQLLKQVIDYIQEHGAAVPHDQVVGSDVIVPPADVTLDEAASFFTDDSHLEPLPA